MRDGVLRGRAKRVVVPARPRREMRQLQALKREHAILKAEHDLLKKGQPVLFRTKTEAFTFLDAQRAGFRVTRLCRLYGVTRAGYYAWRRRGASARHRQDQALHAFFTSVPNRQLDRLATAPDQVWVGDITYLKVGGAWRYLAVVMDRYSRRTLGWSISGHKDARLTLAALNHAVVNRRPRPGLLFHTDRGIECAAYAFRSRLAALGFVQSMNRPREVTDNAHMESFFHSMKTDVVHGVTVVSQAEVGRLVRSYIPSYNRGRLPSGLGYRSPIDYEAQRA